MYRGPARPVVRTLPIEDPCGRLVADEARDVVVDPKAWAEYTLEAPLVGPKPLEIRLSAAGVDVFAPTLYIKRRNFHVEVIKNLNYYNYE